MKIYKLSSDIDVTQALDNLKVDEGAKTILKNKIIPFNKKKLLCLFIEPTKHQHFHYLKLCFPLQ